MPNTTTRFFGGFDNLGINENKITLAQNYLFQKHFFSEKKTCFHQTRNETNLGGFYFLHEVLVHPVLVRFYSKNAMRYLFYFAHIISNKYYSVCLLFYVRYNMINSFKTLYLAQTF